MKTMFCDRYCSSQYENEKYACYQMLHHTGTLQQAHSLILCLAYPPPDDA
jgi:hypothetical protein